MKNIFAYCAIIHLNFKLNIGKIKGGESLGETIVWPSRIVYLYSPATHPPPTRLTPQIETTPQAQIKMTHPPPDSQNVSMS